MIFIINNFNVFFVYRRCATRADPLIGMLRAAQIQATEQVIRVAHVVEGRFRSRSPSFFLDGTPFGSSLSRTAGR